MIERTPQDEARFTADMARLSSNSLTGMTSREHAAVTFDHLITFMAQVDLGSSRMDVEHLCDLIRTTLSGVGTQEEVRFLTAALAYVRSIGS